MFHHSSVTAIRIFLTGKQCAKNQIQNKKKGIFLETVRYRSIKAAVLRELKTPLKIEEVVAVKSLKKNEVRVKVSYCSVNQSDQEIIQALHEFQPKLPFIPGYELSGEVIEVGKVAQEQGFKPGDKIIGLNKESCGGFAEECVIQAEDCYQRPQGVSSKECSALLDGYLTALLGLVRRGRISEGDTVLVTAAGGGVGLSAVDLAANVYKAKVIAVCSTEDKAALVREKGAFAALKYKKNMHKEVLDLTKGRGVQLAFDATGGDVFQSALQCVANEGRLVLASNAARSIGNLPINLLVPNSVSLAVVSPWHYRRNDINTYRSTIEDIIDMAEQDLLSPHVSQEFPMKEVNKALDYLSDSKCTGKVVLRMDD